MRRVLCFFLAVFMVVSFAACSGAEETSGVFSAEPGTTQSLTQTEVTESEVSETQPETVPDVPTETAAMQQSEPEQTKKYCTISIECSSVLNDTSIADPAVQSVIPDGGVMLYSQSAVFAEGESVFDVLQRVCRENGLHLEAAWTPLYNSAYVEGIGNLYEFDCGSLSGWMYRVNGIYPNYGCSRYLLSDGDCVEWRYTCDMGGDIGGRNNLD